jgi:hypothetical protein
MNLRGFCRWWRRKAFRGIVFVLMGAAVLFVVVAGVERVFYGSSEFMGFREIVQVGLVLDRDHYQHIPHVRAYPPFFAIFWSPFGLLPVGSLPDKNNVMEETSVAEQWQIGLSASALLVLMTAMTFWAVRCIAAACAQDHCWPSCFTVLLWLLSGGLMLNSIIRCETDMFVLMLVAGAMCLLFVHERGWAGGLLLGVAAVLKLTPGLFGLYLLCRRRWRAVGGMLLAGVICAAMLPAMAWGIEGAVARHRSWVEDVLLPYAQTGPEEFITRVYRRTNQSLTAATVRYLTPYNAASRRHPHYVNVVDLPMKTAQAVATVLKAAVMGALLFAWLAAPRDCGRELQLALFALVPVGMLLLSDVSVGGHFAIVAVPLGVLAGHCFRHPEGREASVLSWGVVTAFALVSLMAVDVLKELSVATLGAVTLLGLVLSLAWRLRGTAADPRLAHRAVGRSEPRQERPETGLTRGRHQ